MIELSDDAARLDVPRIHGWLEIAGSHCLGAYHSEQGQVGFARVISDRASFAWLADVWVDEASRGQGLGRRMVRWFLDHPDYATVRRFALTTADAHGVYAQLGFTPLLRQERLMERLSPEFTAMLEAAS